MCGYKAVKIYHYYKTAMWLLLESRCVRLNTDGIRRMVKLAQPFPHFLHTFSTGQTVNIFQDGSVKSEFHQTYHL